MACRKAGCGSFIFWNLNSRGQSRRFNCVVTLFLSRKSKCIFRHCKTLLQNVTSMIVTSIYLSKETCISTCKYSPTTPLNMWWYRYEIPDTHSTPAQLHVHTTLFLRVRTTSAAGHLQAAAPNRVTH